FFHKFKNYPSTKGTTNASNSLWPLAVQKFTIEHLLECFAVFTAYLTIGESNRDLTVIGMEKVHWLQVVTRANNSDLYRTVQVTGLECLFNLDVLRDPKSEQLLVDRLKSISPELTVPALPLLYGAYVQTSRRHRGTLFIGDSAQGFRKSLLEVVNQENLLGDNKSQIDATLEEIIAYYLFIGSHLSEILFQLLLIPAKQVQAIPFIELILDYHVKTRTIH
ncbi:hypothetical protein MPER_12247, partial [Moniliophthora perniciosa FA553]